ncbi:MAG: GDP-mannose 4,6-dehydratase [Acidobacteriota bacterium]|nr:GDP-mannose 4,6-dehydratase [Acidobacteriota bacterium]
MTAPDHEPRKVLITGGCGFIGSHLAEILLNRGHAVAVIDDLSTGKLENVEHLRSNPDFDLVIDTILNSRVLDPLATECDVIFHLAAAVGVELIIRDPVHVIETNILGSAAVLKAAARHRCAVLLASTSEIYGKSEATPFDEESDRLLGPTTRWRWCYSTSKAVDEYLGLAYHRQIDLPVTVFRPFNTVGPRQTGHYGMVIPRFVEQALASGPLTVYGDGTQTRSFCDVRDVVRALVGLMSEPEAAGGVFNVGSPNEISILELARTVLRLVHGNQDTLTAGEVDDRIQLVPYDQAYEAGFEDMLRRVPNLSRIHGAIGWAPRIPFADTLRDVIAFHRG